MPSQPSNLPSKQARLAASLGSDHSLECDKMVSGELFLSAHDQSIIRVDLDIQPQELESAVAQLAGFGKGGVAVIAATDSRNGTERLIVLAMTWVGEADPRRLLNQPATAAATRAHRAWLSPGRLAWGPCAWWVFFSISAMARRAEMALPRTALRQRAAGPEP